MNPYEPYWDGYGMSVGIRPKHIIGRGRPYNRHAPSLDGESIDGNWGRARGLTGGAFMGCMMAQQGGGSWTNPYVTNGLMAMVDAAWNAGGGIHSDTKSMVNLGDGDGVVSLSSDCTMHNNYVSISAGTGVAIAGTGFDFANGSGGTIELVGMFTQYRSACHIFRLNGAGWYSSDNYNIKWGFDGGWDLKNVSPATNSIFSMWFRGPNRYSTQSGNVAMVAGNYVVKSKTNMARFKSSSSTFYAGYNMIGNIYSVRVYSRVLTDEELASNHAVDITRFGVS